ncbi:MFS transporter [Curtobacterium sp. ISL-83]|uniref:MFS transporter n=1 Tax=Curtobacterium sp. ISL-83 TaxID=2819145 RepID=UPI001BED099D|nr:MFS transporter [Curtobacterium sp. ISL-83]MBT2504244.1 MFS transporter [Curtobacterium sp. ISL-83]
MSVLAETVEWRPLFNRFWASHSLSQLLAQTIAVAVPLIAISVLHVPSAQVGLVTSLQFAPVLVVTPLLAARIDSVARLPLMRAAHWARGVLWLIAAALSVTGLLSWTVLIFLVTLAGVCTAAFDVATQTFIPNLVPRAELVTANARVQGSLSFAQIVGPAFGGVLLGTGHVSAAFVLFGVAFAASGVLLLRVHVDERTFTSEESFARRFTAGFRVAFGSAVLRGLLINATWFNLFEQLMITTFLVYAVRVAGLGEGTVGFVIGGGAAGALLGAVISGRPAPGSTRVRLVLFSGLAAVAPSALVLVTDQGPRSIICAVAAFFCYGVGVAAYNVVAISLRQRATPHDGLGRVGAVYRMFAYGAIAGGAALSGLFVSLVGLRDALAVAVVALVAGWIVMSVVLVRTLGTHAEPGGTT